MSKNFCTGCGQTLSMSTNFCPRCGKKTNPEKSQSAAQNICRYCGQQYSPAAVFCKGCGQKIPGIELKTQVFEKAEIKTTEEIISTEKITSEDYNITEKNKTLTEYNTSPTTESTVITTEVEPINTVFNNNTNVKAGILTDPQHMTDVKHSRRFIKRPVIISLAVSAVLIGVLTAYLNGWLKNPFNQLIPFDPDVSVYGSDAEDWENSPDLKKEQEAIAKRQRELISNLEKNNIKKAIKYFFPDIQSAWQKQMEDDPGGTATLAAVLSTSEMTFLGKENQVKDDPRSRTASFLVKYEQNGFFITWIKFDGTWYLYDF